MSDSTNSWPGDPRINLQSDGPFAKPYQVRQVKKPSIEERQIMLNADKYTYREEWSEEDGVYIARCLEFPSLSAHGHTPEDAFKEIREVIAEVIEDMARSNEPIPEPYGSREYSGKLSLRLPKHVHKEVSMRAAGEGVSENSHITSCLS
jgi:predicted RNase H-like HicB family nuclease